MSSKSEEDMKPVPFGSLLLKATLAYLVLSLMSILLYCQKSSAIVCLVSIFNSLFMEVMEELAELWVGDISLPLLSKVKLHKVTIKGEGDLLVESCFGEDSHKFVKANLNRKLMRRKKVQNLPSRFRWCQTIGRQSCREHPAHRGFPQKPEKVSNKTCRRRITWNSVNEILPSLLWSSTLFNDSLFIFQGS